MKLKLGGHYLSFMSSLSFKSFLTETAFVPCFCCSFSGVIPMLGTSKYLHTLSIAERHIFLCGTVMRLCYDYNHRHHIIEAEIQFTFKDDGPEGVHKYLKFAGFAMAT